MSFKTIAQNYGYNPNDLAGYDDNQSQSTLFAKTGILPPIQKKKITIEEYHSDFLDKKPTIEEYKLPDNQSSDIVSPFKQANATKVTQNIGENPNNTYGYGELGHEGVDLVNENPQATNPIGGINVAGTSPRGYGNWQVVVGASPEELSQMSPETKQEIRKNVEEYMLRNPKDIRGLQIPDKNISIQAHLAEPAPADSEIATGSANLTMGGTGGWAPHLHSAFKNTKGQMENILDLIKQRIK